MLDVEKQERLVFAVELIGSSLARLADVAENHFNKLYPPKREPLDAEITYVPTEEDRLREAQGSTGEPIEEWIGQREKGFLEKLASKTL